jgi:alpha-D-xyloside xylohydrolase
VRIGLKNYSPLRSWLTCVVFLLPPLNARAQGALTRERDGVQVQSGADVLQLIVCGPDVVHVVATPPGRKVEVTQPPWISKPCGSSDFSLKQDEHEAVIETTRLAVHIFLANGHVVFEDKNGKRRLQEFKENPRHYERTGHDNTYSITDNFRPAEDEAIYGLGQHQNGIFNNRGSEVLLAQKNTDIAIPFFLSTAGYGVLWNSASSSTFDNRFPTELMLKAEAATAIDYYFFYGPEADQIIHHYRELTGHVPMFPVWVYGLFQSKDRYKSQTELLGIAAKYRDPAHSARHHRAGLCLVDEAGCQRLQCKLFQPFGNGRSAPWAACSRDDFPLAELRGRR